MLYSRVAGGPGLCLLASFREEVITMKIVICGKGGSGKSTVIGSDGQGDGN
jgi:GTPase SAR1 family protein